MQSLAGADGVAVGSVGLENTAAKNKLTDTIVPLWKLKHTTPDVTEAEAFLEVNPSEESIVGGDERVPVPDHELLPGGKYRSIVKLIVQYEKNSSMGTGWLIRPDLLVTAGHCAFDWSHKGGAAVSVKAYIGYRGKDSVTDPNAHVQFREGKRIATTMEWLTAKGQRQFDVAFIELSAPFHDVEPFKFADTPLFGSFDLGVVGYPGDLSDRGERGARMYEMFLPTTYNLAESSWRMIEYVIDTYGGNSGSPVIRQSDGVAIGVHVYGGHPNSASVIGMHGNPFLDYIAAFDLFKASSQVMETVTTASGVQISYIRVPTNKTPDTLDGTIDLSKGEFGKFTAREGFTPVPFSQGGFSQTGFSQTGFQSQNGFSQQIEQTGFQAQTSFAAQREPAGFQAQTGFISPSDSTGFQSSNQGYKPPTQDTPIYQTGFQSTQSDYSSYNGTDSTRSGGSLLHPGRLPTRTMQREQSMSEESFREWCNAAFKVGSETTDNILQKNIPITFGPLVGPLGVLMSISMTASGLMAANSTGSSNGTATLPDGAVERAILAEATLVAMTRANSSLLEEEGFFVEVKKGITKIGTGFKKVSAQIGDAISEQVVRMALDAAQKQRNGDAECYVTQFTRRRRVRKLNNNATTGQESFITRLNSASIGGEEGIFDDVVGGVKGLLHGGIKTARPFLVEAAQGVPRLVDALAGMTESEVNGGTSIIPPVLQSVNGLHQRAILAEAALQAVINTRHDALEESGFFDDILDVVKRITPFVVPGVDPVLSRVGPIVGNLLDKAVSTESVLNGGRTLRTIRSKVSMRGEYDTSSSPADFWSNLHAKATRVV